MKVYEIGDHSFENQMATWRILRYKPSPPMGKVIEVEFEYRDTLRLNDNIKFIRKFHYATNESIAQKILENQTLDLSFNYINNFDIEIIKNLCNQEMVFPSFMAEYACFDGKTSFDHAMIGDGEISFANSIFGNADTSFFQTKFGHSNISFYNVDFQRGAVSFAEAVFGDGDLTFEYAIFGWGNAAFTEADFGKGNVYFGGTTFERGEVIFTGTKFGKGDVYFDFTKFGDGNAHFDHAIFEEGNVVFDHCDFQKGEVSFEETNFGKGELIFDEVKFGGGNLDFTGALADYVVLNNCKLENHDKLKFKVVNNLKVHGCIINRTLKITGAAVLSLKDTINLGYIYCDWEKNKVAVAINKNEDTIREKERQFSLLKQNYNKIGAYEFEDRAFVEYMRCRRGSMKSTVLKTLDRTVDLIGNYGTKPGRVAITMLIVWAIFGCIFAALDIRGALTYSQMFSSVNGFYFSAVTFLTIGYGDIVPAVPLTKVLAPVEGMMGLFLMSYFTVSVVRKTLR